ncbi:uncharacterized protein LOC133359582 isoform X2 [Lethenteron reissneri]|uniref:uncharacterized protein LOC133359582 isoform X2 n=1 Tax=Lethenteron reissneri TaxID=7753 RepID=UPI002AB63710|nr:uncharacterized protein LOC133359582 isoform X2 [Lethenteron reissneri]
MIRRRGRRGCWWFVAGVVSERGKMLTAVLALCCCVRLMAATPTESPCPHEFHHVLETGLCCERCKPGQFVENRCTENKGPTTCRECPNGYYTAVENYESRCRKCKECEEGEEIVQTCTESSNTLCRCKAGFHRVDEFCTQDPSNATPTPTGATSGGKTAGIVVAVILLLFVAVAVAAFIYKKKGGRFPCEGEPGNSNQQESTPLGLFNLKAPIPETGPSAEVRDMDESKAAKLIKRKRPQLKKWVGRDPTYLLDYLDSRGWISREKYHEAKDITGKVERADFLINEFIDREECLKLWRALESLQDKYPQLTEWISACASTMPHTCEKELLQIHQTLRDNGFISDYPHVMRLAGLAESFVSEASENHGRNVNERNYAMLRHWRESLGRRATYGRLAEALNKAGFSGTAEMVMKLCDSFVRREDEEEWREEEVQDIHIDF